MAGRATIVAGCLALALAGMGCRHPGVWQPPASGPGSAVYAHGGYSKYRSGLRAEDYVLYAPTRPAPATAPVVVLNHGWGGTDSDWYGAWILHLVRKGNFVIFPQWQDTPMSLDGQHFLPDAVAGVKAALQRLQTVGPTRPDRQRCAVFGHSLGGTLAADMAATWQTQGLPQPRAVFCVEPGSLSAATQMAVPTDVTVADFSRIAPETLLVCLVAEEDRLVGSVMGERIYRETTRVPAANKNLLRVHSERRGEWRLEADHKLPLGHRRGRVGVDALDYYAVWKIGEALLDAAFRGLHREYALGNTPQQRYMGLWPDGTPVRELTVR